MAEHDRVVEPRELRVERAVPLGGVRVERIGQVGVGHALAAVAQPCGEPGLPVVRAGAFQAVQDEE